MNLPDKMRLMADGGKECGVAYDWEELMRLAANEIERLTKENTGMANRLSSVVPYAK